MEQSASLLMKTMLIKQTIRSRSRYRKKRGTNTNGPNTPAIATADFSKSGTRISSSFWCKCNWNRHINSDLFVREKKKIELIWLGLATKFHATISSQKVVEPVCPRTFQAALCCSSRPTCSVYRSHYQKPFSAVRHCMSTFTMKLIHAVESSTRL